MERRPFEQVVVELIAKAQIDDFPVMALLLRQTVILSKEACDAIFSAWKRKEIDMHLPNNYLCVLTNMREAREAIIKKHANQEGLVHFENPNKIVMVPHQSLKRE